MNEKNIDGNTIVSKKRRKKCDEEKPTCRRCKDGGYVCDGYTPAPITRCTEKPALAIVQAPTPASTPSPISCPVLLPGDWLGIHFYNHFFNQTVHDMAISRRLDSDFWKTSFMGPSQDARCIWHATIALGAMHWMFITPSMQQDGSLARFATIQYNEAISELMRITHQVDKSPASSSTVLTCCFLFVLLESLRGNYSEALRHLDSGAKIITSNSTSMPSSLALKQLAASFHAITSQLSFFADDRLFPDLTGFMVPMKKYENSTSKLRDLDEAEDVLNSLDDVLNSMECDTVCEVMSEAECEGEWESLRKRVHTWSTEFGELVKKIPRQSEDKNTRKRILNLKLQQRLWELLVDHDVPHDPNCHSPPPAPRITSEECNELLDMVEVLWKDTSQPSFALKTDLITAVYQFYVFCPDPVVRQRIIALLRSRRRREIIWDSFDMAMFLETDMVQRDMGFAESDWPDIGPSPSQNALLVFRPAPPRAADPVAVIDT
jgi:hypothetical protein